MSSTSNSAIKKEFVVSRSLVVPVVQDILAVPENTVGSIVYNIATQGIAISNGSGWASSTAPAATPTVRGLVFGSTSTTSTTVCLGNGTGTATNGNVFVGWRAGFNNIGVQTGLTFVGYLSGSSSQNVTNKTIVGSSSGINANSGQNSTGVGTFCLNGTAAQAANNCAVGLASQSSNNDGENCSIGNNTLGVSGGSQTNNIAIGFSVLGASGNSNGVINIGAGAGGVSWNPNLSTNVVFIGNSNTLSSNITNVIALGWGTYSGSEANNTFVVADGITQWRSSGLSVSASANTLQFAPATGLITQAASSKRFKENIRKLERKETSDILDMKVCTYDIYGKKDHGIIAEDIPEKYVTFDPEGRRNGVKMLRIIMAMLAEIQVLRGEILEQRYFV
uniref:Peptidase S74 domain-containing protein n=1 Tax=Marseillevirus sp. TaxID=2809551 RepID=A0AA96EL70_9VIRU|nr:hypothetical protein MarFTMF_168 [Marseillevirus sp.]